MSRWTTIWRRMLLALFRPAALAEEAESVGDSAIAVAHLGVAWAAFCVVLYAAGHGPSFTLIPIPKAHYYLAQALFVLPLCLASWWILSTVVALLMRAQDQRARVFSVLGYTYSAPFLVAFVVLDVIIFSTGGFEAMTRYIRFYAPVAPVWVAVSGAIAVKSALGAQTARSIGAVLAGLVAQALLGGMLLR